MIVYLSGPMRSKPGHNYETFDEVEEALYDYGLAECEGDVINPASNFDGDKTLPTTTYMQKDLEQVLQSDALVLLPGWETSEGAIREVNVATWVGKRFYLAGRLVTPDGKPDGWEFVPVDLPTPDVSPRAAALDEAKALITGDRNNAYGPPTQDFARSADALNAYGYRGPDGRNLQAHDVAIMVMSVKLSRLMWTPQKRDSWVDLAGYAGCGYECAMEEA